MKKYATFAVKQVCKLRTWRRNIFGNLGEKWLTLAYKVFGLSKNNSPTHFKTFLHQMA